MTLLKYFIINAMIINFDSAIGKIFMTPIPIKVKQYTSDISLKLAKNEEDNKFAD